MIPYPVSFPAKKFKIKSYVLEDLNNVSSNNRLANGTEVILPFRAGQNVRSEMYADLYEKPRKHVYNKRGLKAKLEHGKKKGKAKKATAFYTVKKGDTLWSVSKKTGLFSTPAAYRCSCSVCRRAMVHTSSKV